jgi:peptide/nickel transport system ATP-binding protein
LDAAKNVSFSVAKGEVLGLVGGSGSGKSTIAQLITRQMTPTTGTIEIDGEDWLSFRGEALRKKRSDVQLIFQDPLAALDPRMKIGTSMSAPMAYHGVTNPAERAARVKDILAEVGLDPSFTERFPSECSGGQLQRIVVGRALLLKPKLLICDEPTSALDASIKAQIMNLFLDLKTRRGITMVMISHDLRAIRHICDRIAVMRAGELIEEAPTETLFAKPSHDYTRELLAASHLEVMGLSDPETAENTDNQPAAAE